MFIISVGCRDNDIILRGTLRYARSSILALVESNLENMTCKSFKESEIWRQDAFQPNKGRADTWISFCKYLYLEGFGGNIDSFPCRETCGFCDGMLMTYIFYSRIFEFLFETITVSISKCH